MRSVKACISMRCLTSRKNRCSATKLPRRRSCSRASQRPPSSLRFFGHSRCVCSSAKVTISSPRVFFFCTRCFFASLFSFGWIILVAPLVSRFSPVYMGVFCYLLVSVLRVVCVCLQLKPQSDGSNNKQHVLYVYRNFIYQEGGNIHLVFRVRAFFQGKFYGTVFFFQIFPTFSREKKIPHSPKKCDSRFSTRFSTRSRNRSFEDWLHVNWKV